MLHSISGEKRKFKNLVEESNRILDPIIDEHKSNAKRDHGKGKDEEDLVDVLLKFHKDNVKPSQVKDFFLTTDNIKAVILVSFPFYFVTEEVLN